jgi:sugar lactone lactonase YvrE
MKSRHLTAIAILAAAAACKPSEQRAAAGDTAQAGTQAAPAAAAAAAPEPAPANPKGSEGWTQVTAVRGFDHPESVWYDSTLDVYFVSNTGNGNGDDSHGFISRLESDGAIDSLRFIADGQNGVTLHTPRGLAILGDTIWVADGKTLRGFDKNSGKSVGDVDFSQLDAELLNDVALGPDGSVFITDTRARDGDGEIFSIPQLTVEGRSRNPQRVSTNQSLQGPNGITWDRVRGHYLVASFLGNDIYSWMPGADPTTIVTGPGRFDGIAALGDGRILVTSWNDSSLMLLRRDSLHSVISGLPEPADIGIDNKRQRVAIPLSATNEVVIFTIPPATAGRKVPTKVTR